MIKRPVAAVIITLSLCCFVLTGFCLKDVQVDSLCFVSDREYFPEIKSIIKNAESSIRILMFEASYYTKHPDSPSNQILHALTEAKKRGVTIEAVLHTGKKDSRTMRRNEETAALLRRNGVDVLMGPSHIAVHSKLVIVDEHITVLGSTNWTFSGLTKNHESNVIIYSREFAKQALHYYDTIRKSGKKT